jgi:PKD repeat protein
MMKFYKNHSLLANAANYIFLGLCFLLAPNESAVANANVTQLGTKANICLNVSTLIPDIIITEGNANDFGPIGTNYTYIIQAPSGFGFDPAASVAANSSQGSELSGISVMFVTSSTIGISYNVTGVTNGTKDALRIQNIKVIATQFGSGNITFIAGESVGGINNSTNHGTLSTAVSSAITVTPASTSTCTGSGLVSLNATPAGGTFSGTGVTGTNFDPSVAGAGTHTVTYTVSACSETGTANIDVLNSPNVSLTSDQPTNQICAGTVVNYAAYGASTYQFFINGISKQGPGATSTYVASGLSNGDVVKVKGTTGICSKSVQVTMTVNSNPSAPTFNPNSFSYATNSGPVGLDTLSPAASPAGGTFSGQGVVNNIFYPDVAGAGTWPITYTYTNGNGCSNTAVKNFNVANSGSSISGLLPKYCSYSSPSTISVSSIPSGWSFQDFYYWNGTQYVYFGLGPNNFNPAVVGVGTTTIYYRLYLTSYPSFVFTWGGQSTTIYSAPQPQITTQLDFSTYYTYFCASFPDSTLNGNPSGGTFSSTVPNFVYNAGGGVYKCAFSVAGPNYPYTRPIKYTYTDPTSGCTGSTNIQVMIDVLPATPATTSPALPYCSGDFVTTLTATNISQYNSVEWYKKSNMAYPIFTEYVGSNTTSSYTPGVMTATDTFLVRQYRYSSCISNFGNPIIVKVNPQAVVSAGVDQIICESGTANMAGVKSGSATSIPTTWSTAGDGNFNNAASLNAIYTPGANDIVSASAVLTITTNDPDGAGGCPAVSDQMILSLKPKATVNAGSDTTLCASDVIQMKGSYGGSATSVSWSGGGGYFTPSNGYPNAIYNPTNAELLNGTPIILTLTTNVPSTYCPAAVDQMSLMINPAVIIDAGNNIAVCAGATISLNGVSKHGINNNYPATWTSNGTGTFGNATALSTTYNPSAAELANGDTITIKLTGLDPDGTGPNGPCKQVYDSLILVIHPLPIPVILNLNPGYCKSVTTVQLNGNYGQTGSVFSGTGVAPNGLGGYDFHPNNVAIGTYSITYTFTDIYGCSKAVSQNVDVYAVPVADLSISGFCENTPITFTDLSTIAQPSITTWQWRFGDGVNSSTQNFTRTFPAGPQTVGLDVWSNYGCTDTKNIPFVIGPYPKADFKWTEICSVDTVHFKDISTISAGNIATWSWDFGVSSLTNDTSNIQNPQYHYTALGTYPGKLKIVSNKGCADSIQHSVSILPTLNPTPQGPYIQTFHNNNGFWAADGVNSSWAWGTATAKDSIKNGNLKVWVTDTLGTYHVDEKSFLNGPCFNFQYLDRPMVVLKIWSATQSQIAGAVLQSSIDGGATWNVEGKVGEGVNWYDYPSVIGNPGSQPINQFAWTGQYGRWKIAKIGLDRLAFKPTVRLRIAFGSSSNTLNLTDGFALDSVWIGNKNKLILLEHFTNYNSAICAAADTKVDNILNARSNSAFSIQYHTSFPSLDPMNQRNIPDPSARVIYYGVSQAPYTVLDGNFWNGNTYGSGAELDTMDVDARTLDVARFNVAMSNNSNVNSIAASAKITANDTLNDDIVVHCAVIERVITSASVPGGKSAQYEWVLKKMLPDAAGTYVNRTWATNDSMPFSWVWDYTPVDVYDPSELGTVVFVQNVTTKEVYQSAYVLGTGSFNGNATGINNPLSSQANVDLFPNPSSKETFVMFNQNIDQDFDWTVYDQLGKVMDLGKISKGNQGFVIDNSNYPDGVYAVRITDGNSVLFKKLMVTH